MEEKESEAKKKSSENKLLVLLVIVALFITFLLKFLIYFIVLALTIGGFTIYFYRKSKRFKAVVDSRLQAMNPFKKKPDK